MSRKYRQIPMLAAAFCLLTTSSISLQAQEINTGATEQTPSRSEYFSWINNTNEGTNEQNTLVNLDFFRWLHDEYGMTLDIYAMDAGVIDGKKYYGSMDSDRFRAKFPKGFGPVVDAAARIGTRMGLWGGPDGFGNTPETVAKRQEEIVSLCRDHNWALFKFDQVCGALRPEMESHFIEMMKTCRKYCPDLILLNHRIHLAEAQKHATTFLWKGQETYIDVHMKPSQNVPYNRASVLDRDLVPELKRLTEDHGVCLSSCLDYWQDDMILQAFNRSLILSPEIYGNPWLLRDDEYPQFARIFNIHKKYAPILVNGQVLPEKYGPNAVSRGDAGTRIVTMRNNSWTPQTYEIALNEEIGLKDNGHKVEVRQFHPVERVMGHHRYGGKISLTIPAFRACMLIISSEGIDEPYVEGCDYKIVRNVAGKPVGIDLLGLPGTVANPRFSPQLKGRKPRKVVFPGDPLTLDWNRKIGDMAPCPIPEDAALRYEATVFAADNNALEVRSLERSGETAVPEVAAARACLFGQDSFKHRGIWDRYLFDGDMETGFWPNRRLGKDHRIDGGCFRLDLGQPLWVDKIVFKVKDITHLQPLYEEEGNVARISTDMEHWQNVVFYTDIVSEIRIGAEMRYMKLEEQPSAIYEMEVYGKDGRLLDPALFKASNLFAAKPECVAAWQSTFRLPEVAKGSYLCVAIKGEHGIEGAYASVKIGDRFADKVTRSTSFPSNTFEWPVVKNQEHYTYYIPVDASCIGQDIDVCVMSYDKAHTDLQPEVWIWTNEIPYEKIRLEF